MNRRGFLKEGLSAIGTVLIPGSGTRTLKDRLTVALAQIGSLKDRIGELQIELSDASKDAYWYFQGMQARNKRIWSQQEEIERLEKSAVLFDKTSDFLYRVVRQEQDHNRWLQEMLDLEMKMSDVMHERWAAAERDKAKLEERLQEVEARTRCVESAYEELWKASARDQAFLEKYITKKYLTLMSKDRESRLMLTDGVTTIDLSDEGCGGVITIQRSN